jgi:hypothetical protein
MQAHLPFLTAALLVLLVTTVTCAAPRTAWQTEFSSGISPVVAEASAPPALLVNPGVTSPVVAVVLQDSALDGAWYLTGRRLADGTEAWRVSGPAVKARDHSVVVPALIDAKAMSEGIKVAADYYANHSATTEVFKGFAIFNSQVPSPDLFLSCLVLFLFFEFTHKNGTSHTQNGFAQGVLSLSPYTSRTVSLKSGEHLYAVAVDPTTLRSGSPQLALTRYTQPDFTRPRARFSWGSTAGVATNAANQPPLEPWAPDLLVGRTTLVQKLVDASGRAWMRRVDPLDLTDVWRVPLQSIADDVWVSEAEDLVVVTHAITHLPHGLNMQALSMTDGRGVWAWRTMTDLAPTTWNMTASVTAAGDGGGHRQFCGVQRYWINFSTYFEWLACVDPAKGLDSNATTVVMLTQFDQSLRTVRGATADAILVDDWIGRRVCAMSPFGASPTDCVWAVPVNQVESDIEYLAVSPDDSFIVTVRQASLARWDLTAALQ